MPGRRVNFFASAKVSDAAKTPGSGTPGCRLELPVTEGLRRSSHLTAKLSSAKSLRATSLWKVPVEGGEERQVLGSLSY